MSTIEIKNVTKRFGTITALKNVTLTFESGKIYGFLGRNGAGKTTLLNVITNKLFANEGNVLIGGEPSEENDKAQANIFCMSAKDIYPVEMRVKEVLKWTGCFYPGFDSEYAHRLLKKFELHPDKKVKELSTGYHSILKLILTLSAGTPIMIFDEPVLGLDANHRELFYKELLSNYGQNPKTIIISTHLIDEVAEVIEDVIIIKQGEIVIAQPVEDMIQSTYIVSGDSEKVDRYITGKNIIRVENMGNYKSAILFEKCKKEDKEIIQQLELTMTSAKLQEVFISLTNS